MLKKDQLTFDRVFKVLEKLNNDDNYYIGFVWDDVNETEQDIRNAIASLRKIRGFPIEKDEGYIYRFAPDFVGILSEANLELIATSIATHKLNPDFNYMKTIYNIFKPIEYGKLSLPLRSDLKYKEIEDFESYELSPCIANEMAIRNRNIEKEIRKFYYIENLLTKLSFNKITNKLKNAYIANNLRTNYWLSVYHCEINHFGELSSIEYSKDKHNDLFAYNDIPIDSLLKRQFHLHNNEKYELETYQKIDFKNIMSDRNPDGFKLSQEYTTDKDYYSSIIPDFHRKILDPNLVSVPLNFSLPKEELIAYISHIKDSLFSDKQKTDKSKQVLTVSELLNKERYKDHKKSKRYPTKAKATKIADYLYIYDYVTKRIQQQRKSFLREQEKAYIECLEKYKTNKQNFINNIEPNYLHEDLSKQYNYLDKSINSTTIDNKDLAKNKYIEVLQLYTTYYMSEIQYLDNTNKYIDLTLQDIAITKEQKIELFYKISLTCFYIIEDYRYLLKEIRRIKKLPIYNNNNIKKYKKSYISYYNSAKLDTYKVLKALNKLKELVNPNKQNTKPSYNFLDETYDEDNSNSQIETINIESILCERKVIQHICIMFNSLKDNETIFEIIESKDKEATLEMIRFMWQADRKNIKKEDSNKIFVLWQKIYEVYKENTSRDAQAIFSTLSKWFVFIEIINDDTLPYLSLTAKYTEKDHNSYFIVEELERLVKDNPKYVGKLYIEMLNSDVFPSYKQEQIQNTIDLLFQLSEQENALIICNLYKKRGIYFLNEISKKYKDL